MTNTGPPTPAMRLSVAWICGSRMASQLALPLSNRRYAPCVLAQSPQASLIGEAGELTSCSAVLIKRRSKRLSDRSTPANSSHTHSTDAVPASMIACTSGSSHRAVFAKRPATLRRTSRRTQGYQMSAAVSSAPYAALSLTAQRSRLVWNRQVTPHYTSTFAFLAAEVAELAEVMLLYSLCPKSNELLIEFDTRLSRQHRNSAAVLIRRQACDSS